MNNKYLVHVISEVVCISMLALYMLRTNRNIQARLSFLESKIQQYEQILQDHNDLIQTLVKINTPMSKPLPAKPKQVVKNQPQQVVRSQPQQPSSSHQPPVNVRAYREKYEPTLDSIPEENVEDIIETDGVYEDNLDEEIENELSKLNLTR
jgi:hypothetical protein